MVIPPESDGSPVNVTAAVGGPVGALGVAVGVGVAAGGDVVVDPQAATASAAAAMATALWILMLVPILP
jgi:hypothetical protein